MQYRIIVSDWSNKITQWHKSVCHCELSNSENKKVKWEIASGTTKELNAVIYESSLAITPSKDIEGNAKIIINAKINNEIVASETIYVNVAKRKKRLALGLWLGIGIPILVGTVAGIAIGVTSNKGSSIKDTTPAKSEVVYENNPITVVAGGSIVTGGDCKVKITNKSGEILEHDYTLRAVSSNPELPSTITFSISNGKLQIDASSCNSSTDKTYTVSLYADIAGETIQQVPATFTLNVNRVATQNSVVYDNVTYSVNNNVEPSTDFCWHNDSGGDYLQIPTTDGVIKMYKDESSEPHNPKLTSLIIKSIAEGSTSVADNFLEDCQALTSLDVSGFSSITTIGKNFLTGCKGLSKIDISSITSNSIKVGSGFLADCTTLYSIKLPVNMPTSDDDTIWGNNVGLSTEESRMVNIDCGTNPTSTYMADNKWNAITAALETAPAVANRKIANWKYSGENKILTTSKGVEKSTSTPKVNEMTVTSSSKNFTFGSITINSTQRVSQLKAIALQTADDTDKNVDDNFLSDCPSIIDIDLSGLQSSETIGKKFLSSCANLKRLDLSFLVNTKTIDNNFYMILHQ